ncbi:MAG: MerR family DNA-binding protein [Opitutaceae bacterium]
MNLFPATHRWPDSGYRDFDEDALARLRFIRSTKELGFTLNEIKALVDLQILPGESCAEVKRLLEAKRKEITQRVTQLKRLRRALDTLIIACARRRGRSNCPALSAILRKTVKLPEGKSRADARLRLTPACWNLSADESAGQRNAG